MKPKTLDNIIAMVALYRPGPMAFIPDYIARMHGEADVEYRHPALEPIFQDTFGIPVYQEQLMRAAVELAGYTPSESDELRKAISKKNKKDIDKHREKFVNGAVKQGMDKATAEAIYNDWEEFARYGFNKSHAADYGVIAVQTAYLKSHYPAEYMTALLSASAGITEKVAFYISDARNMGVRVLPIDINTSGWDFSIEDVDGSANIRFGFGAVKNVGQGAVELILRERDQNGTFKNLNDFSRRVDLRAVGKRALECLIKVGAMDSFGNRAALLASLDRIISISSNHFRAAEAGQMSLFGAATGVVDEITLPDVNNVDKREMLNWERELIGLYISDHPLTPYQKTFAQIVSYFSGQLGEAQHEEKVRVAGLITSVRPYMTKTNKPMGFVTLEDVQGNIELVLFPKTWASYREQLKVGQIVIVEGKVDMNSTPPKVLVDSIRTEIKILESLDESLDVNEPLLATPAPVSVNSSMLQPGQGVVVQSKIPAKPNAAHPVQQVAEKKESVYGVERDIIPSYDEFNDMPPPPDNFPDGWDSEWQPSFDQAAIAARPEPVGRDASRISPNTPTRASVSNSVDQTHQDAVESNVDQREHVEVGHEAMTIQPIESLPNEVLSMPPSLYVPLAKEEKDKDHRPHQITLTLRSTGDKEWDKRRIKTLYGTLISFHGRDRFSFQIFENGSGHLIDFPNDTTRVCTEMLERLKKLMGQESWQVEEITFQ
jgi:DNA polymerase-3 subunit alpha